MQRLKAGRLGAACWRLEARGRRVGWRQRPEVHWGLLGEKAHTRTILGERARVGRLLVACSIGAYVFLRTDHRNQNHTMPKLSYEAMHGRYDESSHILGNCHWHGRTTSVENRCQASAFVGRIHAPVTWRQDTEGRIAIARAAPTTYVPAAHIAGVYVCDAVRICTLWPVASFT